MNKYYYPEKRNQRHTRRIYSFIKSIEDQQVHMHIHAMKLRSEDWCLKQSFDHEKLNGWRQQQTTRNVHKYQLSSQCRRAESSINVLNALAVICICNADKCRRQHQQHQQQWSQHNWIWIQWKFLRWDPITDRELDAHSLFPIFLHILNLHSFLANLFPKTRDDERY